jgi:hypothetical protein
MVLITAKENEREKKPTHARPYPDESTLIKHQTTNIVPRSLPAKWGVVIYDFYPSIS